VTGGRDRTTQRKQNTDPASFGCRLASATLAKSRRNVGIRETSSSLRFDADNGKDPALERHELRSGATVAELCDEYVTDMESHKLNGKATSTKKSDRSRVEKHIKPKLGKLRVAATTQLQIENERLLAGKRQKTNATFGRDLFIRNQKGTAERQPMQRDCETC
jgi:hypothetical protein